VETARFPSNVPGSTAAGVLGKLWYPVSITGSDNCQNTGEVAVPTLIEGKTN